MSRFSYLGVHISEDLSLTQCPSAVIKKARQCLYYHWGSSMSPHLSRGHFILPLYRESSLLTSQPSIGTAVLRNTKPWRGWWVLMNRSPDHQHQVVKVSNYLQECHTTLYRTFQVATVWKASPQQHGLSWKSKQELFASSHQNPELLISQYYIVQQYCNWQRSKNPSLILSLASSSESRIQVSYVIAVFSNFLPSLKNVPLCGSVTLNCFSVCKRV